MLRPEHCHSYFYLKVPMLSILKLYIHIVWILICSIMARYFFMFLSSEIFFQMWSKYKKYLWYILLFLSASFCKKESSGMQYMSKSMYERLINSVDGAIITQLCTIHLGCKNKAQFPIHTNITSPKNIKWPQKSYVDWKIKVRSKKRG